MTGMPPIAVLAGGLAKRMRPLTDQLPKALLEVAGEPFLAHQLRLFARQGIAKVKLLVGYRWEQVRAFAGDGSRFGVEVDYIVDGPRLFGTGGAIRRALDRLGPEFLVTYGDTWLDSHKSEIGVNGADTLITLDTYDTITLKGVAAANLHASDFIVSPHH